MTRTSGSFGFIFMFTLAAVLACANSGLAAEARRTVKLDGTWDIAQGRLDRMPAKFEHRVPVPGLADMAKPPFKAVGEEESKKYRQAFWYRRTFKLDGPLPAVALLKIHKAKFGTRLFLNGRLVGDHLPCFTPALLDVRDWLKGDGQTNELVIRVGALRDSVPPSIPNGFDFEKIRYIPGVYDSVELILSGTPHIASVQAAPDLAAKVLTVAATVRNTGPATKLELVCKIFEASSGKQVGQGSVGLDSLASGVTTSPKLRIPIEGCRAWSPEDPFLYRLEVSTGSDTYSTRFGMRSFSFDPETKRPLLNGKPYPMRGTNVCIYRFFEDPTRTDLPWHEDWVRRLHRLFKEMHWNSIRYCIGFPPERWYDIADEEGFLIQDEFPIWFLGKWPEELKSEQLVKEYTEWMRERWNHPCVVIWDAQNETRTEETGKAIAAVRGLDLSNRPWDNGWEKPQRPMDVYEAHPYPFIAVGVPHLQWERKPTKFRLSGFADAPPAPGMKSTIRGIKGNVFLNEADNPVIINEYGWLWLGRDGSPTTLTKANYEALLGPNSTIAGRRRLWAKYLAAMTEYWRCRRRVAGVLHFCGLGYSRPIGQTSDHFLDIEKLILEPDFKAYVGDSFAPVGLMIDHWADTLPAGSTQKIPVVVINDLYTDWQGTVRLSLMRGDRTVAEQSQPGKVQALGQTTLDFQFAVPQTPGGYQLVATLVGANKKPVSSHRDFSVKKP